jgi:hypothetical protein
MMRSGFPEPACSCKPDAPDPLCAKHGVFVDRWSGEFCIAIDAPPTEVERRERARRRRLKPFR